MGGERDFRAVGALPVLAVDGRNVLLTSIHRTIAQTIGHDDRGAAALPPGAEVPLALTALLDAVTTVGELAQECGAARIVVADDTGYAPWRRRIFPEYKAARKKAVEADGRAALARVLADGVARRDSWTALWGLLGAEVMRAALREPMEADDIIARVVQDAPEEGYSGVVILSSDGDLCQLLGPSVVQVSPLHIRAPKGTRGGKGVPLHERLAVVTEDALRAKYLCSPEDWVFRRAVLGDQSDGIPGVRGIGEATLLDLFRRYGDMRGILEAADDHTLSGRQAALEAPGVLDPVARNMALINLVPPPLDELVLSTPCSYPEGVEGDMEFEGVVLELVNRLTVKSHENEWERGNLARKLSAAFRRVQTSAARFHSRTPEEKRRGV